jgi:hypothetical protein
LIDVFNGTHAVYLNTQQQDGGTSPRRSFTASNQNRYFSGTGPYTINAATGAFVNIQLACTVAGVVK